MKVLVAGASGFVGCRLCPALAEAGHNVVAMTRNPAGYAGTGTPVHGDVHHPHTLGAATAGCQAAYYLVHSLSDADFERKDAAAAAAFGQAGARAGLQQIIYLGGLGDDKDALSPTVRAGGNTPPPRGRPPRSCRCPAMHPRPMQSRAVRARRRRVVTATGVGGAGLLGISLSTKAGSPSSTS